MENIMFSLLMAKTPDDVAETASSGSEGTLPRQLSHLLK